MVAFIHLSPNGSIRIKNSITSRVLTYDTTFTNSSSNESGGSIYVTDGACIQYRVCSIDSTIPDKVAWGCHSFIDTKNESILIECSISRCRGETSSIYLSSGNQSIDTNNISYAKCISDAAVFCSSSDSHRINFTSIINNTSTKVSILYFTGYSNILLYITNSNVIDNFCTNRNYNNNIVLTFCNSLDVSLCRFISNNASRLFSTELPDDYINVDRCYLENNNVFRTGNDVVMLITTNSLEII